MSYTNELPEALWLAGVFDGFTKSSHSTPDGTPFHVAAAAELRRLHAECEALRSAAPTAPSDANDLRARLLAHAEVHDACTSEHSDEQAQWARDLRKVAELIAAPTAPAAEPQQSTEAWIAETMAGPPPDHPAWEAGPQQGEAVAYWIPKAEQFCAAPKDGSRPFAKAWEPLYPAPAVERGVTEAREFSEWLNAQRDKPVAEMFHEIVERYRAALTATGAAQGDGAKTDLHEALRVEQKLSEHLRKLNAKLLDKIAQQEAPAAQPLTDLPHSSESIERAFITLRGMTQERGGRGIGAVMMVEEQLQASIERAHGIQPAATKGTT